MTTDDLSEHDAFDTVDIINHHPTTRISYKAKIEWWQNEINGNERCSKCWLRNSSECNICYCSQIDEMAFNIPQSTSITPINMCIYYHYQEIGRSANTAHIFESLSSSHLNRSQSFSSRLMFGDIEKELELIQKLNNEQDTNTLETCILYPSTDSIPISQWANNRPNKTSPINIITLDGTYPQASRQYKYLKATLKILYNKELPVVKLHLDPNKPTASALLGIQSQPGVHKLCSYQAMVMAMQQAGESEGIHITILHTHTTVALTIYALITSYMCTHSYRAM